MPPAARYAALLAAFALAALVGACGSPRPLGLGLRPEPAVDASRARADLRRLTAPLAPADTAGMAARARYARQQMQRAGLTPVFEDAFYYAVRPGGAADVLGYVPGRHPTYREGLVLVAADQSRLPGAAALEAARLSAARAAYTQDPARSVLFALWAGDAADGVARWRASPTWALGRLAAVVVAAEDSSAAFALRARLRPLLPDTLALAVVVPGAPRSRGLQTALGQRSERDDRVVRLAERLDAAVLAAAADPDTVWVRADTAAARPR